MVLYSLGRSPCCCLSLQWQPPSVKCFVSTFSCHHWLSSFPDTLDLITQMSSTFIKGKGKGEESERAVSTLLMLSCIWMCMSPYLHTHLEECGLVCGNIPIPFRWLSWTLSSRCSWRGELISQLSLCLWQIRAGATHQTLRIHLSEGLFCRRQWNHWLLQGF